MFVPRAGSSSTAPTVIEKPPVCGVIKTIAIKIFLEMAASLAIGGIVALYVATPAGLSFMLGAAAVQFAVSVFFHSLGAYAAYRDHEKIASLCQWVTGFNFGVFSGFNGQILIHESGHAMAALLTYKNPRPIIEIHPFVAGSTQFYKTGLSPFGQKLGAAATTCFVIASGPALTLLVSSALLAIGIALLENYPQLGKTLIGWATIDFLNHAVYAYSALGAEQWNLSHDFVHLSIFGLHPVAASIGIIAIPILIVLGLNLRKEPQAISLTAQTV